MASRLDNIYTGLIAGILLPPLVFYLFALYNYPGAGVIDLIRGYISNGILTHVVSLSALVNLGLFFLFLRRDRERSAKGVILASLLYFGFVLVYKIVR